MTFKKVGCSLLACECVLRCNLVLERSCFAKHKNMRLGSFSISLAPKNKQINTSSCRLIIILHGGACRLIMINRVLRRHQLERKTAARPQSQRAAVGVGGPLAIAPPIKHPRTHTTAWRSCHTRHYYIRLMLLLATFRFNYFIGAAE